METPFRFARFAHTFSEQWRTCVRMATSSPYESCRTNELSTSSERGHGTSTNDSGYNPAPVRARGLLRPSGDAAGRPSTTAGRSPQRRARGTRAAGRPSTTQPSPDEDEVPSSSESSLSATASPSCTAATSSAGSPMNLAMQFRWYQYFVVLVASPKVCTTAHHTDAHIHFHAQVRAAGRNILIHVNLHRAAHCDQSSRDGT